MTSRRFVASAAVASLTALLALAQLHFVLAHFGPLRRTALFSWDSPATQMEDELACESLPHTDPSRESREHALLAPRRCGAIHARPGIVPSSPTLPSSLSRSPPPA